MNAQLLMQANFLRWLAGEDSQRVGEPELHWANLPESWGVFVFAAAVLAILGGVVWLYRHEMDVCPLWMRRILALFRALVLLLLVLMLLRPTVTYKQVKIAKPVIALLRDTSLSLARQDHYTDERQAAETARAAGLSTQQLQQGQVSRSELVQRSWASERGPWLEQLRDKGALRVIDFAAVANQVALLPARQNDESPANAAPPPANSDPTVNPALPAPAAGPDELPPFVADGRGTDLYQALNLALGEASRLAAIVLVSDGQHNGSSDPLELADKAKSLGIPIYPVAVGDPARPTNLAVTDVYARSSARPGEPFEIEALLYAEDLGQSAVTVELVQREIKPGAVAAEGESVVSSQEVSIPPGGGRVRVDFQTTIAQPGRFIYQVRVPELEGEMETADNRRDSNQVDVIDEQVRVLLIAGGPLWDYQLLQRLLQRDPNISLTCWLQSVDEGGTQAGDERISNLPRTIEELGRYNVIILMDPNPDEFDKAWIDNLQLFCKRKAGGLLFVAGPHYTADFLTLNDLAGIREILPVRFGGDEFIESSQILNELANRPGKMLVRDQYLDHPIMAFFADPAETKKVWDAMPNIYWNFPTTAAKPIAQTLVERGDLANAEGNQPLLVTGRYGAGTVVYLGFHGTYLWRQIGLQAQYFDRFWIQLTRFLTETRSLSGSRRGVVDVDRNEYELGDKVTLLVRALNERFEPLTESKLTAVIRGEDNVSLPAELRLIPGQEGSYEGAFVAQRIGVFRVEVQLPGTSESDLIEPVSFRVIPPSAETNLPWRNDPLLQQIAANSGGKVFQLYELQQLATEIPRMTTKTELRSPPVPLWDLNQRLRLLVFALPVVLLTVEWALRKKFKLL